VKPDVLEILRCPRCADRMLLEGRDRGGDVEVETGELVCRGCAARYPVRRFVPRLVPRSNYSASWGKLWRETGHLLRDSFTGVPFHENVLHGSYSEEPGADDGRSPFGFAWPRDLSGARVLEVGTGTGNVTEHLVETGAEIVSVDMSDAIDSLPEELLRRPNLNVVQADINDEVLDPDQFDRIWLFQVLQHTPSPPETLRELRGLLKEGGEIAFTSYGGERFRAWYYPLTKRLPERLAWRLVAFLVPRLVPLKYRVMKGRRVHFLTTLALKLLEPIDPRDIYFQSREGHADRYIHGTVWKRTGDEDLLMKYVVINTFDRITPRYTNTATHETVERWLLERAGYSSAQTWGTGGVRATAVR
jgi:SAM-dependent methyltransferase